jgi:hypothetical protein
MKKTLTILYFLLFYTLTGLAQEQIEENSNIGAWIKGKAFTLVSNANVREKPNIQSSVLSQLPIASEIKIEKVTTDSFTVNGFRAPWCQISYDNGKKKGYLWAGFIARIVLPVSLAEENADAAPQANPERVVFLGGISTVYENRDETKSRLTMQLRVAKNNKEIAKIEFVIQGNLYYSCNLEALPISGFEKVAKVFAFSSGRQECDYPQCDNVIFFTKENKLIHVLGNDPDVFYPVETYILPSDKGGITNHIIVTEDSVLLDGKYKITLYKWDGVKLVKLTN